jgi:hypothetical protein
MTTTATLGLPLVLRTGNGGTTGRIEQTRSVSC